MKIKGLIFVAIAASVASCAPKISEITEITGTVNIDGVAEVRVLVEDVIDTLVPVNEGKFSVAVAADVTKLARVTAGSAGAMFISDGTPLEVVIDEETVVTSKFPKVSIQERLNSYNAEEKELMDQYMSVQKEIFADSLLTQDEKIAKFDAFYKEFIGGYVDHQVAAAEANTDNFVAVLALNSLRGELEDSEMDSLIGSLAPAIQDNRYVSSMKQALTARLATAVGSMFTDFTVEHVYGYDRSMDPQPLKKEVKFSDYVGKGTYVLVDFWSPWCGPCRREIPNIKTVYDSYKDKGLEVLSLAVWERKPQSHTIEVAGELGMDWLHINNCGSVPTDIYGVEGIPHLMLIGPDGTILERGFHGLEGIENAVAEHLK